MPVNNVEGWDNREGRKYWGTDRLSRMIETRNLEGEEEVLLLLDHIDLEGLDGGYVADIGCGIGRRHRYFKNMSYVGFDREEVMLDAGRKYFPELTFKLCDVQELKDEFPEYLEFFDLVLTFHVIQYNHIRQQESMLDSISYILKPGALFYMKENTIYEHNNIGYSDLSETHSINGSSFTEAGWISHVEKHKFKLESTANMHGHFLFRRI